MDIVQKTSDRENEQIEVHCTTGKAFDEVNPTLLVGTREMIGQKSASIAYLNIMRTQNFIPSQKWQQEIK